MTESQTLPFFSRLGTFCRYVDSQVMELKEELVTHDQKPHNYDRGLRCLKNDVKDLKKLTEDIQHKLVSIENFSSYLQSMQELVVQQATDIDKIEKYLLTFGYAPLPKQEKDAKNCEVTVEVTGPSSEQKKCVSPDRPLKEEDNPKTEGTPVLSNVGLMVVQGKQIPTVTAPKPVQAQIETPIISKVQSKCQEETKPVFSLSSLSHSYMTVDQWLAGVNEPVELTPDVLPKHKMPMRKQLPQHTQSEERDLHLVETTPPRQENPTPARETQRMEAPRPMTPPASQRKDISVEAYSAPSTPNEPQLSEYTTSLLSLINRKPIREHEEPQVPYTRRLHAATPEEPGLSTFTTKSPREEKKSERVYTPEEPALSYSEKKLAFMKNFNKENYTPEEPVLSYKKPQGESENPEDERTPEEPFLSSAYTKSHSQSMSSFPFSKKSYAASPTSPQLSNITQSVLSFVQNPVPSHSSHRQTEQYHSHRNPTEPRKSEMPRHSSSHRSSSHPYNPEPGSFSRSMMDTLRYQTTYSELTSSQDEAQKSAKPARYRPGMEEFLKQDDVPASPQLSDVTQRIIGQTRRW
ncbi:proteoglycan 4-like [Penaeus chinensis]|uniref:proteoglycan 4-like n=1 Tax=Penaeus chinensis TaxID=139456 RepID=UPI001FB5F454|nr:proteoglycan 4-like [Penaeus chinensis]